MTTKQKASLIAACILYVLTVFGFFYFSLTLIVILFLAFSVFMVLFAYFSTENQKKDNAPDEHFQQEIGMLKAEKEQVVKDYDTMLKIKDDELDKRQEEIDELNKKLSLCEEEKNKAEEEIKSREEREKINENLYESLLPPDENDASEVDIIEVAAEAIADLDDAAKAVGLKVTISSASERLMVKASAKRLLVMFKNIIDNSIKYMKKAGTLVVTISTIEDDIFIVLKDTGEGLPENETKHIFELNYQGSNRISGNGLGLTQAKAIVEHYGGTIYARSPGGNGMGIYIQLPTT